VKKTKLTVASVALFWSALSILACFGAIRLGVGRATDPGSGFIFFWSGLILVVLSLLALAESLRSGEDANLGTGAMNWWKTTFVLLALLSYAFFLEKLGFVLTTFVLMSFLLAMIEGNLEQSLGVAGGAARELRDFEFGKDQVAHGILVSNSKGEKMARLQKKIFPMLALITGIYLAITRPIPRPGQVSVATDRNGGRISRGRLRRRNGKNLCRGDVEGAQFSDRAN
jgi:putative tricarboxylic transport membrane protein